MRQNGQGGSHDVGPIMRGNNSKVSAIVKVSVVRHSPFAQLIGDDITIDAQFREAVMQ